MVNAKNANWANNANILWNTLIEKKEGRATCEPFRTNEIERGWRELGE